MDLFSSVYLQDEMFDGVMFNQVLHHLQSSSPDGANHHVIQSTLREASRVLKTGGILMINTCLPHQLLHGYWWYRFIPAAAQKFADKYPSQQTLTRWLTEAGFSDIHVSVPLDQFYRLADEGHFPDDKGQVGEGHFPGDKGQGHCLLKEEWRATDSFWALPSKEEINDMEARVRKMIKAGTLQSFIEENDKDRLRVGQYAIMSAKKI